ncbi:ribonuclease P protein component [Govanella unica]|uniref:Ribonuclease P protein component n=1 Tax=Govanella unica TaxID=2975056 RepID=A0A9X3TWC2_9PROT|nr:ribonuclease P protein component [Govania unica]MDA5192941.1 ribonuclease P protein component [Govania unica]
MTPAKPICRLKKRPEFLRVAEVRRRWSTPGLMLQVALMTPRKENDPRPPYRYGITASRKVGGSVVRNRAKRRLRVLAESLLPDLARPGYDFVLIARPESATRPYDLLISDLKTALTKLKVTRARPPEGGVDRLDEVSGT